MQQCEMEHDQAEGLRRIVNPSPVKVIAVSSGKGGVGKTNVSVNLAVGLSQLGQSVMLLDADLGLANVDVMLGLNPSYDLSHVISGERTLNEVIIHGPEDVKIVPAASGVKRMANLTTLEQAGLINAFSELGHALDVLIVDTAAGIHDSVINFCCASQEVMVVVCDEPASITDAYAFIKVMSRHHNVDRFNVLANMVGSNREGRDLFRKLSKATDRFLDVVLNFIGTVPFDDRLKKSVQHQRAVVDAFPRSTSAVAFKRLSREVMKWPVQEKPRGQLEFFIERISDAGDASEGDLL